MENTFKDAMCWPSRRGCEEELLVKDLWSVHVFREFLLGRLLLPNPSSKISLTNKGMILPMSILGNQLVYWACSP